MHVGQVGNNEEMEQIQAQTFPQKLDLKLESRCWSVLHVTLCAWATLLRMSGAGSPLKLLKKRKGKKLKAEKKGGEKGGRKNLYYTGARF